MHLFAFDGVDERLALLPLSARRALDRAGLRLSREGWASLGLEARRALATLGAATTVDVGAVEGICATATPAPEPTEPIPDPPATVPGPVRIAFGPERPVSDDRWAALDPLSRYALAKVAEKARPERLAAAWAEIVRGEKTPRPDGSSGR